ncbi:hypothetical protein AKJ55_00630 [candidate division MSBL1 archaeon SCGC-AAA382M17]|uniref:HTH HARE-type domain-containing protein n=1 Tax=candidate division MSBL1 archaeon SCGC-AAA382M17 TaxID=1698284 RepID=A0ABR5TJV6_9EURY|nr:hypothetical protein AKJ55_00630 [candidate division MSBL1 archaeon SCGC-AAA382M17]
MSQTRGRTDKESEQMVGYVREACENLSGNFTPSDISEWIKENKGVEIQPEGVGLYAKRIGYSSELTSENGKRKRVLKPISE